MPTKIKTNATVACQRKYWQHGRLPSHSSKLTTYASGEIDDDWPRGKVHKKRIEYERVDINNFGNNWNRMKKSIGGLKQLAARDLRILHSDKLLYPTDPNRWDGSLAQALLKQDIRDDFHEWFSSKDLYLSRIEYKQFDFER